MAQPEVISGIDVGSTTIRTLIGQRQEEGSLAIIGIGVAPSEGLRRGVVVDVESAVSSISAALEAAERMAGMPVARALVAITGEHVASQESQGVIAISRPNGEIGEDDINRVIDASAAISIPPNREIVHIIPKTFSVDGQRGIKDPTNMNGVRLEVVSHLITGSVPFMKNLTKCVYQAGVDVEELVFAPLASANAVLTKRQRELGVTLIDIGGGTTSVVVYEEGNIIGSWVFPIGGMHITNDIAIGLRTSIDVAEAVKLAYGVADPTAVPAGATFNLKEVSQSEDSEVSQREVAEMIEARVAEIFGFVDGALKKIDRSGMLPIGAVLTGGTVKLPGMVEVAKRELRLPAKIGIPSQLTSLAGEISDPSYAVVSGLLKWGASKLRPKSSISLIKSGMSTVGKIRGWLRNLLP
ncbi:MAG: cell division protein FtsA [Parcubacteria group bacterium]|nr:cell division protein FtsA [Parcubacteria group bacterium]